MTSAGVSVVQFTVSTISAGTGEIQLDSTSITSGQTVSMSALTLTLPELGS